GASCCFSSAAIKRSVEAIEFAYGIIVIAAYASGMIGTSPTAIVESICDFQVINAIAAAMARMMTSGFASTGSFARKNTGTIISASVIRFATIDGRSAIINATAGISAIM